MSTLYKKYLSLKIEDGDYFYLFENGIFYIFIGDDAISVGYNICLLTI